MANDDVDAGEQFARFDDHTVYPSGSDAFEVRAEKIILKQSALYTVSLNVCYVNRSCEAGEFVLYVNETPVCVTRRSMPPCTSGMSSGYTFAANEGDTLKVAFDKTDKFKDLKINAAIMQMTFNEE